MTVEGPLGGAKRGSWLISGRKSYLDLIVRKLREEGLSFGFADAQAKLRHDVGTESLCGADLPGRQVTPARAAAAGRRQRSLHRRQRLGHRHRILAHSVPARRVHGRSAGRHQPVSQSHPDRPRSREGRHRPRRGTVGPHAPTRPACECRIRCAGRAHQRIAAEAAPLGHDGDGSQRLSRRRVATGRVRAGAIRRRQPPDPVAGRARRSLEPDEPDDRLAVDSVGAGAAGAIRHPRAAAASISSSPISRKSSAPLPVPGWCPSDPFMRI